MFTDTKFMTAKEKEQVLKAWERFLKGGCKFEQFTKALYHHLTLHCDFIAHYDRHGFYSYYFTNPTKTLDFIGQFDHARGYKSTEIGMTYWLTSQEYADINGAMCDVVEKYKADIYANCRSEAFKRDTATITAIMAKHNLNNVLAVEGGYRFS